MSLRLDCLNDQDEVELPSSIEQKLTQLLEIAGRMESVESGDVTVTFVNDVDIRELNRTYRDMDKPTDVLSFSMWEGGESDPEIPDNPIGDIVISLPTAKRQSEEYGHSLEREIGFLFVHGFLHLIGYDHQNEEAERVMFEKQEKVLQEARLFR